MDDRNSDSSGGGKSTGTRSKGPCISTATRLQRNQAEKERRDKLNGFISELATLVPMLSNASKPLDKVSILRLTAAEMRLHFSCLNPKRYNIKPLALPPSVMGSLDVIEKGSGGFVIVTTLTGLILFCSRSIEDYLNYQNIDVMGNKVTKYIYEADVKYFEEKLNSVVNSLKKGPRKKSKVIKVHMLQKPLPRSNEGSRPRSMIFKLSVHQNDTTNGNGSSNPCTSIAKKARTVKDFGYSAVVLMFIEPVRLEPEIDITYIESNQDVYFTRHGLKGEITYADQRIATITGYLPHDVQGMSAYQYICSSDVPIALFAQKAMFTSSDGKGDIVYRLRIRDMRYIYLQSSGQIAYKESTNEVSHFVCFNRLLSEEEGSQELKKFQQRYAPQIMAAKLLQGKQKSSSSQAKNTDLLVEQSSTLMNPSLLSVMSPAASVNLFQGSKVSSPDIGSSVSDQILSSDNFATPPTSSIAAKSEHSHAGHSTTSPSSYERSSSIPSEYSGYKEESMDFVVEKTEQMSPLKPDSNSFIVGTYNQVIDGNKSESLGKENYGNGMNGLDTLLGISKSRSSEDATNINGSYTIQPNGLCTSANYKIMHPVNAFASSLQSGIAINGTSEESLMEHNPMDFNIDHEVLHKNASVVRNTTLDNSSFYSENNGLRNDLTLLQNGHQNKYVMYNGQTTVESNLYAPLQSNQDLLVTRSTTYIIPQHQQVKLNGGQVLKKGFSQPSDLSSFSEMYEVSSSSSLSKNSNNQLSVVTDVGDSVNHCSGIESYPENFSNGYLTTGASSYIHGANETVYNGLGAFNPNMLGANLCEINGFHLPVTPVDVLSSFPAMNSVNTPIDMAVADSPEKRMDLANARFLGTVNARPPMTECQNVSSDAYTNICGPNVANPAATWTGRETDSIASMEGLNTELYEELDLFFQNLPQSDIPQNSSVAEFPVASSSYHQNSISSSTTTTKRNYRQ